MFKVWIYYCFSIQKADNIYLQDYLLLRWSCFTHALLLNLGICTETNTACSESPFYVMMLAELRHQFKVWEE